MTCPDCKDLISWCSCVYEEEEGNVTNADLDNEDRAPVPPGVAGADAVPSVGAGDTAQAAGAREAGAVAADVVSARCPACREPMITDDTNAECTAAGCLLAWMILDLRVVAVLNENAAKATVLDRLMPRWREGQGQRGESIRSDECRWWLTCAEGILAEELKKAGLT